MKCKGWEQSMERRNCECREECGEWSMRHAVWDTQGEAWEWGMGKGE